MSTTAAIMPFGRHKGVALTDLNASYLNWLGTKLDELRDPLRGAIAAEIARRKQTKRSQGVAELVVELEPSPSSPPVCIRCDRPGTDDHPLLVHEGCSEVPF
jgi:hypothetical protein